MLKPRKHVCPLVRIGDGGTLRLFFPPSCSAQRLARMSGMFLLHLLFFTPRQSQVRVYPVPWTSTTLIFEFNSRCQFSSLKKIIEMPYFITISIQAENGTTKLFLTPETGKCFKKLWVRCESSLQWESRMLRAGVVPLCKSHPHNLSQSPLQSQSIVMHGLKLSSLLHSSSPPIDV